MKLILSSAGFATEEIIAACESLVGKPRLTINVAIINEAYVVEHDNNLRWVLDDLNNVLNNFGGNLELVNLLALDSKTVMKRIEQNDVIYVVGGHTDYLMSVFNRTGFTTLLPNILKSKVYVGSSAGSMIIGNRITTKAYRELYNEPDTYGTTKFLGLVDFAVLPHLDSPQFINRKETLTRIAEHHSGVIYGLRDDSAVIVNGDSIATIGSAPYILNQC